MVGTLVLVVAVTPVSKKPFMYINKNGYFLLFIYINGAFYITVFPQAFALVVPVLALFAMKIQNYYRRTSRELKRLASIARSPMYYSGEHLAHFSEEEDLNWVVAPFSDLEWLVALLSGPVCFLNNHDRNRYDWFSCTLDGLSTIRAHEMVSKNVFLSHLYIKLTFCQTKTGSGQM